METQGDLNSKGRLCLTWRCLTRVCRSVQCGVSAGFLLAKVREVEGQDLSQGRMEKSGYIVFSKLWSRRKVIPFWGPLGILAGSRFPGTFSLFYGLVSEGVFCNYNHNYCIWVRKLYFLKAEVDGFEG